MCRSALNHGGMGSTCVIWGRGGTGFEWTWNPTKASIPPDSSGDVTLHIHVIFHNPKANHEVDLQLSTHVLWVMDSGQNLILDTSCFSSLCMIIIYIR